MRNDALAAATAYGSRARAVVLVEGRSDSSALQALAVRAGHDLHADGVFIVPMGGATNIWHFVEVLGPRGLGVRLAGLCDEAEERVFRWGLRRAGLDPGPDRAGLERLGFFVCVTDLEDELIRALGSAVVEQVIDAQGELRSFRKFQKEPGQRDREHERQLRRFMGTRAGRKILYGHLLASALDPAHVPGPLDRLLGHLSADSS